MREPQMHFEETQQTLNTYTQNENDISTNLSKMHISQNRVLMNSIDETPTAEVIAESPELPQNT